MFRTTLWLCVLVCATGLAGCKDFRQRLKSDHCMSFAEDFCRRDLRLDLASPLGSPEGRDRCLDLVPETCSAENFPANRCLVGLRTAAIDECRAVLGDPVNDDLDTRSLVFRFFLECRLCDNDVGFEVLGPGDSTGRE